MLLREPARLAEVGARGAALARPAAAREIAALVLQRAGVAASAVADAHGAAAAAPLAARATAVAVPSDPGGPAAPERSVTPAGARRT